MYQCHYCGILHSGDTEAVEHIIPRVFMNDPLKRPILPCDLQNLVFFFVDGPSQKERLMRGIRRQAQRRRRGGEGGSAIPVRYIAGNEN